MKYALKIFLFLLFFILVFLGVDQACYDDKSSAPSTLADLQTEEYDVIFIGASRQMVGVKPALINEVLGLKTANFSSNSESEELMYQMFKFIGRNHRIKSVVVDAARVGFSTESLFANGYQGFSYLVYDGMRNPTERAKAIIETLPKKYSNYVPEAFSSVLRDVHILKLINNIYNKKSIRKF